MPRDNKTSADSGEIIQSGKWNASKDYTLEMVFRPLHNASMYERMARFGSIELVEEYGLSEEMKKKVRIDSMRRLLFELIEVINNCEFSLKGLSIKEKNKGKKSDRDMALEYLERLYYIEDNLMDFVYNQKTWGDKKSIEIDEYKFKTLLKELHRIRRDVTRYADNAELIYFQKEPELTKEEMDELIWKEATEK